MAMCRLGKKITFLFVFGMILVACGGTQSTPTVASEIVEIPTHTPQPAATATTEPTAVPTQTATSSSTPTQTATSTPTPSPTATPDPTCPEPGNSSPFTYPADTTELQASILAYLNEGGQWEDLFAMFDELEIEYDWMQADMNGDGVMETAVYANFADEEYLPHYVPYHVWWVFKCQAEQYLSTYETWESWAYHDHFLVDDLNNDNHSEIFVVKGFAGSACTLEPTVWIWEYGEIIQLSPDYLDLELGCSTDDQIILHDINDDNFKDMILVGDTVGHIDHAPLRHITQTFTLENEGYVLASTVFSPADFRIHALDDAQRALDKSDIVSALEFYNQAAYNDQLSDHYSHLYRPDIAPQFDFPGEYQRAFALFRLVVIQLSLGNKDEAYSTMNELISKYPTDEPGHEFVILTQEFFDSFNNIRDLEESCNQVTELIIENYPELTSHFYWGTNIAYYQTPDSICPIFPMPTNNEP